MSKEFYPVRAVPYEEFLAKVGADPRFDIMQSTIGERWRYIAWSDGREGGIQAYNNEDDFLEFEAFGGAEQRQYIMQAIALLLDTDLVAEHCDGFILRDKQVNGKAWISITDVGREEADRLWAALAMWQK